MGSDKDIDGGCALAGNRPQLMFTGGNLERGDGQMVSLRAKDGDWYVLVQSETAATSIQMGTYVSTVASNKLALAVLKCTWAMRTTDNDSCWGRVFLSDDRDTRVFESEEVSVGKVNEGTFGAVFFAIKGSLQLSEIRIGATLESVTLDPVANNYQKDTDNDHSHVNTRDCDGNCDCNCDCDCDCDGFHSTHLEFVSGVVRV
jgi:hypothetical protein